MIGMGTTIFLVNPVNFASPVSYLLDTYSATRAFSLRQLKTGVTNVVRVRRSSDSAESDFTADEITDGTLTAWTGANDGFVVVLYDQMLSGSNASNATANAQPRIVNSGVLETLNGKPAMSFDGSNDYLGTNAGNTSGTMTLINVFNRASSGINSVGWGSQGGSFAANNDWRTNNNDYFRSGGSSAEIVDSGNTSTGQFLSFMTFTSTNSVDLWKNGLSIGNTSITLGYANTLIDAVCRRSSIYHNGYFQEAIIFTSSDLTSDRTDIESDINTHYSIY